MIGELVAGFKLTRKLGEGGTGETYLAEGPENGGQAAVKLLFPQISADRALIDRLCADATAASKVNHVGMVDLYACGVHASGRAFLAMELLEGKTLTDALIELGAVTDVPSFADIGWQLATLLAAAHAAGLVHGGLKPDSIFLTFPPTQAPRPLVRVLDFGMAKFSTSVRHSQTGSLLGAPLYMSPEVGRGLGGVDHRADIYSLGCILFELLCGRPPFVREGKGELIIAHATEAPPPVASLEPSVPQAIDNLIGRMLTKNPAARPQSMGEVAAVLERFFDCPAPGAAVPSPVGAVQTPGVSAPIFAPPPPPQPPPSHLLSSPPTPTATPTMTLRPVAPGPGPRRQDPTALLPPGAELGPLSPALSAELRAQPATWTSRVRERTAILQPGSSKRGGDVPAPWSPGVELPAPDLRPRHRGRQPAPSPAQPSTRRPQPLLNLPLVLATASILLAVGATVLLLRSKKASGPRAPVPASVERSTSRLEPFRPPPSPVPEITAPLPPQPLATPEEDDEAKNRPPLRPSAPRAAPPIPKPRAPAKRW